MRGTDGRHVVAGIGVVILVAAGVTYGRFLPGHLARGRTGLFLLAAHSLLLFPPPIAIVCGAARLRRTDLDAERYATVAAWTGGAALATVAFFLVDFGHRYFAGEAIAGEFVAVHTVAGLGVGGALGMVAGYRTAQARTSAERARARREEFGFLNNVLRHHVLNRINVVIGHADRLEPRLDQEGRASVRTIREQSESIAALVGNVRAVSDALSGPEPTRVDLVAVLEAELDRLRAAHPEAVVEADLPGAAPVLAASGLSAALDALLSNAVEHSDAGRPRVEVRVVPGPDEVDVEIADDGPGIPDDAWNALREPGSVGDREFGLYLADRVVEASGGTCAVEDRPGGGTVVTVTLPVAAPDAIPDPDPDYGPAPDPDTADPADAADAADPVDGTGATDGTDATDAADLPADVAGDDGSSRPRHS